MYVHVRHNNIIFYNVYTVVSIVKKVSYITSLLVLVQCVAIQSVALVADALVDVEGHAGNKSFICPMIPNYPFS